MSDPKDLNNEEPEETACGLIEKLQHQTKLSIM